MKRHPLIYALVSVVAISISARLWLQSQDEAIYKSAHAAGLEYGDATFTRPSIAFLYDKEAEVLEQFEVNEPRYQTIACCSVSDGEYLLGEWNGDVNLVPHCIAGEYMYATSSNGAYIYRRAIVNYETNSWQRTNTQVSAIINIFGLSDGGILYSVYDPIEPTRIYYSSNGGTTTVQKLQLSPTAVTNSFSYHQAINGTAILVEYGPSGTDYAGRYIYRWDPNTKEFTTVYDANDGDAIDHFHAVCKQESLGRWIAVAGDRQHRVVASDDDGLTWYEFTSTNQIDFQPMALVDYNHPTRLLFGSDRHWMMGSVDVSGDTINVDDIEQLIFDWSRNNIANFCRSIFFYDGVWYASSSIAGFPHPAVIMVSTDLQNWVVYHRFKNNESSSRAIGLAGGKIHYNVSTTTVNRHFQIKPAQVALSNGIVLEPAATNLLDDANKSSAEYNVSDWKGLYNGIPMVQMTGNAVHGLDFFNMKGNDSSTLHIVSNRVNIETNKAYEGRFWVRGKNCHYLFANYVLDNSNDETSFRALCHPSSNHWQELVLTPYCTYSAVSNLGLRIVAVGTTGIEVDIDAAQIAEVSKGSWQLGGSPRMDEKLNAAVDLPQEWTNIFTFYPELSSDHYSYIASNDKLYIKSWKAGNCYAELYYVPHDYIDRGVHLYVTDGQNSHSIKTSKMSFVRHAQIKFAVVCYRDAEDSGKTKLRLHISNGSPVENIQPSTSLAFPAFSTGPVETCSGNNDGNNLFPGIFADDKFIESALLQTEVAAALDTVGLAVLSPNGGEAYLAGAEAQIRWFNRGSSGLSHLEYSLNDGNNWSDIGQVDDTGAYEWLVPSTISNNCLVRITDANDSNFQDISDDNFSIYRIRVLWPNGGEHWPSLWPDTIHWEADPNINNVVIEYSINDGNNWTIINTVENNGQCEWTSPEAHSNQCLIRICNASEPDIYDISDGAFSIFQCAGPVTADLNGDCYVTLYDLYSITLDWLEFSTGNTDLDENGHVDFLDFAVLGQHWLDCANPFDANCP